MNLTQIHHGRILTHLNALLCDIEYGVNDSGRWATAIRTLHDDPVYRQITNRRFSLPFTDSIIATELRKRIGRLRTISGELGNALMIYLDNIERSASPRDAWGETGYFIVPVIDLTSPAKYNPALFYLQARSLQQPDHHLHIDGLTEDQELLSTTTDYFAQIAMVLMKTLFLVNDYPFDELEGLTAHAYRLYFGCRITEGKSMGAAMLATFAIAYLHNRLGANYLRTIAPQRGTLLTGEIGQNGQVQSVGYLREKVTFALEEYGSSLKVILPAGEQLPAEIERRIGHQNLFYVKDAEELLVRVLSSPDDPRGLNEARKELFRRIRREDRERLRGYLISGVKGDVYETIANGLQGWRVPQGREGVYVIGLTWSDQIDVKLATNPAAWMNPMDGQRSSKELIEFILDGSAEMEAHWRLGIGDICDVTAALFEVAACFDDQKQDLVVFFLSDNTFIPIRRGTTGPDLQRLLQYHRDRRNLARKGAFLMPVFEASFRHFLHRQKRIYVLSNSWLPDAMDLDDTQVSEFTQFRFTPDKPRKGYNRPPTVCLGSESALYSAELRRRFCTAHDALKAVEIDFGEDLPMEWQPINGTLALRDSHFVLHWSVDGPTSVALQVKLALSHCRAIQISGAVADDNNIRPFSFPYVLMSDTVVPFSSVTIGTLSESDARLWSDICSADSNCPECGRYEVHLIHSIEGHFLPKPVLSDLHHLHGGYLLLQADSCEWRFFINGCRINGIAIVKVNERLHFSEARGYLHELELEADGTYILQSGSETYYICWID